MPSLECPDGYELDMSSNECKAPIPTIEQETNLMPVWAFVLTITLVLVLFAVVLFLLYFAKKKMQQK